MGFISAKRHHQHQAPYKRQLQQGLCVIGGSAGLLAKARSPASLTPRDTGEHPLMPLNLRRSTDCPRAIGYRGMFANGIPRSATGSCYGSTSRLRSSRRTLRSRRQDAGEGAGFLMTKMFKIDLPVGVTLWINGHEAHYIGGGSVVSTDPIWMIHGVTADGSDASRMDAGLHYPDH